MLTHEPVKLNQGYPESLKLSFARVPQDLNTFYTDTAVQYPHLDWMIIVLGVILTTAMFILRQKKVQPTLKAQPYKNEISLKLTLARQYCDMGNYKPAVQLLNGVLAEGNAQESEDASALLKHIEKTAYVANH